MAKGQSRGNREPKKPKSTKPKTVAAPARAPEPALKGDRRTPNLATVPLSVEQPIAGDELRAIRRYLATRSDATSPLEFGTMLKL